MDMRQTTEILVTLFLLINTYWDVKKREVLMWSVVLFGILGGGLVFAAKIEPPLFSICGMLFGMAVIGCAHITGQAIGYGDGLVIGVCGIYLGFLQVFVMVFYALVICSVVSAVMIVMRRCTYKTYVPFLPYLLAGYVCVIAFS